MRIIFSLPEGMYRNSYCTTPSISIARGIGISRGGGDVIKMFYGRVLNLCDGQSTVRQAILYTDRSCFLTSSHDDVPQEAHP